MDADLLVGWRAVANFFGRSPRIPRSDSRSVRAPAPALCGIPATIPSSVLRSTVDGTTSRRNEVLAEC